MNGADGPRPGRAAATAAGAWVGASVWISQGVLAVVDVTRVTRVAVLPDWRWLGADVVVGMVLGLLVLTRLRRWAPLALLGVLWLPWMPWPVPASWLAWEGPLEGVVWTGVMLGLAWDAWRRWGGSVAPRGFVTPARAPWIAAASAAALIATAWTVDRARVPAGDEPHYLVITQSLLGDGDLRIENNHRDGDYLAYFDGVLKPDFMRRGTDGQIYSIHAPGVSALVLPMFAVAGYSGAVALVIAVAALGVALTWTAAFTLTPSAGGAWLAAGAVALSAPFLLHGYTVYPDPVAATMAMVGVTTLIALERGLGVTTARWMATGAALALLPWLHTRLALVAGVLGAALSVRQRARGGARSVVPFLAVPVVSALAWFGYFWILYGVPNPAAPYGARPGGGLAFVPTGLAGLLVDQQFGLTAHAPILAAGGASLLLLMTERPRLGLELTLTVVAYLTAAASYPMWWGGYSAPARFAVAVLPIVALPLTLAWRRLAPAARVALVALLALSAAVTAALVAVERGAFIYNGRDGYDLLLDWLNRSVDLTLAAPSVHRDGAGAAVEVALIWTLSALVMAATATRLSRIGSGAVGRVAAWLAVPAAIMSAMTVAWAGQDRGAVTPSTSQMSLLERWRRAPGDTVVQLTPTRRLDPSEVPRRLILGTSPRGRRRPTPPLLQIPQVPAGIFDVFVETVPGAAPAGTAVVRLGRDDLQLETWRFDERPEGFTGLVLQLPVPAHSITVTGDAAATASIRTLSLRPRALAPVAEAPAVALRAMRLGRAAIFALDDDAYLEPGAIWVRGERSATMVVAVEAGVPAQIRLAAGPVANEVELRAGAWSRRVPLAAEERVEVELPAEALAPAQLTITSTTGFRPSTGGTGDIRWLGVYLTWPSGP